MSISKSLRNRIVGLLVLVSLIMIIVPAMMDPREVYDKKDDKSIAVNSQGAVVNNDGQLVSPSEHDYTDLLAPEDDSTQPLPSSAENSTAPLTTSQSSGDLEVPDDNMFGPAPTIIDAKPLNSQNSNTETFTDNTPLPSVQDKTTQPSQSANTAKPQNNAGAKVQKPQQKPVVTPATPGAKSGDFAVQVGVFSNQKNADSVIARLKMSGYSPITQTINVNGKTAVRIYAAFAKSRDAARKIASEIQSRTGFKCNVVSH